MPKVNIADATGKLVEVSLDLSATLVDKVANFARDNRDAYFEDHSLDWALEEIVTRGVAEITRQIKTARKTAQAKASMKVLDAFNLSPSEAQALLAELARQKAEAAAKAKAK